MDFPSDIKRFTPYILLSLNMLFWSVNNVISKAAVSDIPPAALAFWPWVIGVALLTPWAFPRLWKRRDLLAKHWLKLVSIGTLSIIFFYHLFYNALTYTTAINSSLIAAILPIITMILAWMLYRDSITSRQITGTFVALCGVVVVIVEGNFTILASLSVNVGDLLMLAAVTSFALYSVLLRHMPEGLDPLAFLWVFAFSSTIGNGIIYFSQVFSPVHFDLTWPAVATILFISIFPTVLAFIFYNAGVRALGAAVASQFLYLVPILAALLAVLLLGEEFRLYHLVGLIVILAGLYVATAQKNFISSWLK